MQNRIRGERTNRKMSQDELADLLSVTPQTISKWETDVGSCKTSYLVRMSAIFGCTVDYLIGLSEVRKTHETKEV